MLTRIVEQLSEWFEERRASAETMKGQFAGSIEEELQSLQLQSRFLTVSELVNQKYRVEHENIHYVVDVLNEVCSCCSWQRRKVPCIHVISILRRENLSIRERVSNVYLSEKYKKTYVKQVVKLRNPTAWERSQQESIIPPDLKRRPGRPSNRERVRVNEGRSRKYSCSLCGQPGHSKKNCPGRSERVL
ncbi:hypothetical protein RCL1_000720 [Eukaryota sp. TZLM3-RCL]